MPEKITVNAHGFGPRMNNVVEVKIPASSYYNLKQFNEIQKTVLGRLGCEGCTSGWDIRYDIERQFVIDAPFGK